MNGIIIFGVCLSVACLLSVFALVISEMKLKIRKKREKINPIKLMDKVWKKKKDCCVKCTRKIRLFTPIIKRKEVVFGLETETIICLRCWLDEQKRKQDEKK